MLKSTCQILQALRIDALDTSNTLRVLQLTNYKRTERLKSPQRNTHLKISKLSCGLTLDLSNPEPAMKNNQNAISPTRCANEGLAPRTCSASGEWSLHDKRVLRNRMILGVVTMPLAWDCQHLVAGIIVFGCGLTLLATAALDRWLGKGETPNDPKLSQAEPKDEVNP